MNYLYIMLFFIKKQGDSSLWIKRENPFADNRLKLAIEQICIQTVFFQKDLMGSAFCNTAVFHDQYYICIPNGGKTVGNDKAGTSFHHSKESLLDVQFSTSIDIAGSLIQN